MNFLPQKPFLVRKPAQQLVNLLTEGPQHCVKDGNLLVFRCTLNTMPRDNIPNSLECHLGFTNGLTRLKAPMETATTSCALISSLKL